jgi:hypothetical protein
VLVYFEFFEVYIPDTLDLSEERCEKAAAGVAEAPASGANAFKRGPAFAADDPSGAAGVVLTKVVPTGGQLSGMSAVVRRRHCVKYRRGKGAHGYTLRSVY